ncbi:MAG: response regulator [Campylobacterota bacterium]
MVDPDVLKKLRKALHHYPLLYVEENPALNAQAGALFKNIFDTVYATCDATEGMELYEQYRPAIVVADIKTPLLEGLKLAKNITAIDPSVKIIFTSAHDDKALLHEAIRLGAFDYVVKPITVQNLVDVLVRCARELRLQMHQRLFNNYLQNIFNYQHNLILLLHRETVVMANQPCLEFFGAASVEEFGQRFLNFGDLLLEHSGFLYNHDKIDWLKEAKNHPGKLFNVKIADAEGNSHHFVLNMQTIPDKEEYYILSLNDVSELNLLRLFDPGAVEKESIQKDKRILHGLFEMAKRNNAKIKVHNLYKGLSITNDGIIDELDEHYVWIKTTFMQLKAMQFERRVVLVSDIFPMFIVSTDLLRFNFDRMTVKLGECRMSMTSPTRRQYIRVPPDSEAKATLLFQGRKFETEIQIADISIKAMRLILASLPAGFQTGSKVILDFVLGAPPLKPIIINTEAEVYRIGELYHQYEAVFTYELRGRHHKELIDYIAKRQMQLIREFKERQNE